MIVKSLSLLMAVTWTCIISADNQTPTVSPIFPSNELPFRIQIEQANFSLPNGFHSGAQAQHKGKWLFITGRTNGLHGFDPGNNNFPPSEQNKIVYVVDPVNEVVLSRSLEDPSSGLTPTQVDLLSVTSPQSYQSKDTLYITGGYGVDSSTGLFSTKDTLTAINIPGLIHWVTNPAVGETAVQYIRQISNPIFQVTGGFMTQIGKHPTLLVFGQNFTGFYHDDSNGDYTEQVRRFHIIDDEVTLRVNIEPSKPKHRDPSFRRRDLNVVPIISKNESQKLVAFSGVFTLSGGAWTVPVKISANGHSFMHDPFRSKTFKQSMNNYVCPTLGLFSKKHGDMYTTLFGGISYGFFSNGTFQTDPELPFINQVTTIELNKHGHYKQFLMDAQYPVILSTQSNPGNQLLFGAGADFLLNTDLPHYENGVLKLDKLGNKPILVGYIVGGIQSTLPNTNTITDSSASPYIFKVILIPKACH